LIDHLPALVIEGRVKNTSAKHQTVPLMLAVLNDKQGKEIRRRMFPPDAKDRTPRSCRRARR